MEQVSRSGEQVSREQVSRRAGEQEQVTGATEDMYANVWCKTTSMMSTSILVLGVTRWCLSEDGWSYLFGAGEREQVSREQVSKEQIAGKQGAGEHEQVSREQVSARR